MSFSFLASIVNSDGYLVGIGAERDVDAARVWYERVRIISSYLHIHEVLTIGLNSISLSSFFFFLFLKKKALEHGSTDAAPRLAALNASAGPKMLSRAEHETLTESTLVRKRTQAKQRADARYGSGTGLGASGMPNHQQHSQQQGVGGKSGYMSSGPPGGPAGGYGRAHGEHVVELIRKSSLAPNQATFIENNNAAPSPPSSFPQTQSSAQGQGQGQGYVPPHPRTSSLSAGSGNGPSGPARPPLQQQQQQQQQFANRPRYSLADPGSSPGLSGTPPPGSGGPGSGGGPAYFNSGPGGGPGGAGGRPGRAGRIASASATGAGAGAGGVQTPPRTNSPPNAGGGAGGTKYNTFAEMGIHASKAEEKECVIM